MSVLRLLAIIVIFAAASIAWMILGGTVVYRTESLDQKLSQEVASLWGPKVLVQPSPYASPDANGGRAQALALAPASSEVKADIKHAPRYKGLLWYSTFSVSFDGTFNVPSDPSASPAQASRSSTAATQSGPWYFMFPLPSQTATYDNLRVTVDETNIAVPPAQIAAGLLKIPLQGSREHVVHVAYTTGGQDVWLYSPSEMETAGRKCDDGVFAGGAMSQLAKFSLAVMTDFTDIDYPKGTRSPTSPAGVVKGGREAKWQFDNAITNQPMGVICPKPVNAGPVVSRMSFFAPVSLLFFFVALFAVVVLKKIPLHPMHYLFISGGFFAFHILLAYLAELVNIHGAFWICAVVSTFLVVSYLRLVAGVKFAVLYAGLAQVVYLVGFSYAFFWVGYTGLAVTVGAIVTLFVLMQATGRVNWHEIFRRPGGGPRPADLPPGGTGSQGPGSPPPIPRQPEAWSGGPINIC